MKKFKKNDIISIIIPKEQIPNDVYANSGNLFQILKVYFNGSYLIYSFENHTSKKYSKKEA